MDCIDLVLAVATHVDSGAKSLSHTTQSASIPSAHVRMLQQKTELAVAAGGKSFCRSPAEDNLLGIGSLWHYCWQHHSWYFIAELSSGLGCIPDWPAMVCVRSLAFKETVWDRMGHHINGLL